MRWTYPRCNVQLEKKHSVAVSPIFTTTFTGIGALTILSAISRTLVGKSATSVVRIINTTATRTTWKATATTAKRPESHAPSTRSQWPTVFLNYRLLSRTSRRTRKSPPERKRARSAKRPSHRKPAPRRSPGRSRGA
jgi:hypothetical protein